MRLSVIGTAEDVIGFALAGSPGALCTTGAMVLAALESECRDPDVALVLVSGEAADLAPDAVQKWSTAPGAPILIVLPGAERAESVVRQPAEALR
jgi:vacuolar-type H+-ATPase subunit F/Vma7